MNTLDENKSKEIFLEAYHKSPMVKKLHDAGMPNEVIIGALVQHLESYKRWQESYEQICPRKYRISGVEFVWHCPDNLIPMSSISE